MAGKPSFDIGRYAKTMPPIPGADVPRTIDTVTGEILRLKQDVGNAILDIGRRLIEAKELLPHGEWLPWLTERVQFSERTAQNFMRLAREWSDPQTLADIGTKKAIMLLSIPADERQQYIAEPHMAGGQPRSVADMSSKELEQALRRRASAANPQPVADLPPTAPPAAETKSATGCGFEAPAEPKAASAAAETVPGKNPAISDARLDWRHIEAAFCARVAKHRQETGMTRKEFAASIGEYPGTYAAWENRSLPGCDRVPKLALALGVTTDYLFGLTDDPKPPALPEGQLIISGYMPGGTNPGGPCSCVALMDAGGRKLTKKLLVWNGVSWSFPNGASVEMEPSWWLRLPEDPEKSKGDEKA